MEKLTCAIFSHCADSLSQVIHSSKNTVYITTFLEFLQFLHSGLSGIKDPTAKFKAMVQYLIRD